MLHTGSIPNTLSPALTSCVLKASATILPLQMAQSAQELLRVQLPPAGCTPHPALCNHLSWGTAPQRGSPFSQGAQQLLQRHLLTSALESPITTAPTCLSPLKSLPEAACPSFAPGAVPILCHTSNCPFSDSELCLAPSLHSAGP